MSSLSISTGLISRADHPQELSVLSRVSLTALRTSAIDRRAFDLANDATLAGFPTHSHRHSPKPPMYFIAASLVDTRSASIIDVIRSASLPASL
jgi:hypothetical protein